MALDVSHLPLVQNWRKTNDNGNEKCSLLLLVARFRFLGYVSICRSLLFTAFRCSFLLLSLNQFYLKNQNRQMPSIARFGFLSMFPSEHRNVRFGFLLVRKTKTRTKRQKVQMGTRLNRSQEIPFLCSSVTKRHTVFGLHIYSSELPLVSIFFI